MKNVTERPRAVDVQGLKKVYGSGAVAFEALKDVDFHADAGEFVVLAGPSGSGKTTLLSILGCVLRPTAGRVALFDDPSRLVATACPVPELSTVNRPGAAAATGAAIENVIALWYDPTTCAVGPETPYGTMAVIWFAEAYRMGAAIPPNAMLTPPSCVPTCVPLLSWYSTAGDGPRPEP